MSGGQQIGHAATVDGGNAAVMQTHPKSSDNATTATNPSPKQISWPLRMLCPTPLDYESLKNGLLGELKSKARRTRKLHWRCWNHKVFRNISGHL